MIRDVTPIEISGNPELARLAREVAAEGRPRLLQVGGIAVAVLSPVGPAGGDDGGIPADADSNGVMDEMDRRRRRGLRVTDITAGILSSYAKTPSPTPGEETAAFEQGIAGEVLESMKR